MRDQLKWELEDTIIGIVAMYPERHGNMFFEKFTENHFQSELNQKAYKALQKLHRNNSIPAGLYDPEFSKDNIELFHHITYCWNQFSWRESEFETFLKEQHKQYMRQKAEMILSEGARKYLSGEIVSVEKYMTEFLRDDEDMFRENIFSLADLHKKYGNEEEFRRINEPSIRFGFTDLDSKIIVKDGDLIIIAGRPSTGKCLGKGTKLLMYDGSIKSVEEIMPGDKLMGDDSSARNVISINSGKGLMYWVKQNRAMNYRTNEQHILTLRKSRKSEYKSYDNIIDIELGEYLKKSGKFKSSFKGFKVPIEFDEKTLSIEPYFMGLWLGDGNAYWYRITNEDEEIVEYLRDYANRIGGTLKNYKQKNKANEWNITFSGKGTPNPVFDMMRRMGYGDGNKFIHKKYLFNSTENRLKLLAGLLDSDGYYDRGGNVFEIASKYENLARQIKFICDSLGFGTSIRKKKTNFNTIVYRLFICGNLNIIPTKIKRKQARELFPGGKRRNWRNTGITIEADIVDDYYGFVLDGNGRFLLEDCTVTHNTDVSLSMSKNISKTGKAVGFISLEMRAQYLMNRLAIGESRQGNKLQRYLEGTQKIAGLPMYIDESPKHDLDSLHKNISKMVDSYGIKIIFLDYLTLLNPPISENRTQEVEKLIGGIKQLAREFNIPIAVLSQLSREVEKRKDKKPILADLRQSGAIEQDADLVMFTYRPFFYGIKTDKNGASLENCLILCLQKQRDGVIADVPIFYDAKNKLFGNWAK